MEKETIPKKMLDFEVGNRRPRRRQIGHVAEGCVEEREDWEEERHSYEKHMIRHAPALNEVDTVAPLPIAVTTSVDDATEDIKPDNLEITSVLNVQVEAPRCMTRSASKLNNANIRMEMSQEFQSVSKNIQSKILGTIRKLASNSKENKEKGLLTNTEGVRVNNENVRVKIIGGTKVLIERKMKKPTSKYGWYCRQCDVMFESSEELDDHKGRNMCSNHPCQFCDKKFKTKNSLVKHERLHTNERPYMCEQCGKSFRTRTILRSHLDTHDKSRKFICTDCGKAFNNKANFKHHTATHLNRAFLCDICGKTLKSLSYLRVHKLNHKNPDLLKRFACDMCGNKYVSRHQMKQHRRLHTNERPYKCPDPNCFKMFRNLVTLKQHASVHTNMRKYKCEACGKGFKRRSHLMTHRKTHDQHQRFRCGICPDSFNNLGELLSHRSSHTEEELKLANKDSLKCPECSKILLNKVTLKNHMLTHSNERPFPCSFCEKSFKNKTHRDNHLRLHTGEKPFICRFCKAAFTVSERLVVHERIHTGETPFKCNMCDKAFRSKINLIQHSKIHSDNRPFICSLCARAFRRREALDMHMRTHTGERPYACKYCNRAFKQKGDCNKHQKTHFKSGGPVMETPLVACRHPVYGVVLADVLKETLSGSSGPDSPPFKSFRTQWILLNQTKFAATSNNLFTGVLGDLCYTNEWEGCSDDVGGLVTFLLAGWFSSVTGRGRLASNLEPLLGPPRDLLASSGTSGVFFVRPLGLTSVSLLQADDVIFIYITIARNYRPSWHLDSHRAHIDNTYRNSDFVPRLYGNTNTSSHITLELSFLRKGAFLQRALNVLEPEPFPQCRMSYSTNASSMSSNIRGECKVSSCLPYVFLAFERAWRLLRFTVLDGAVGEAEERCWRRGREKTAR
uniref:C2H2-type domain-containing protein n=1 Tax=Timema douglasi TaxID=61478 RepID=A0A7R8Z6S8_TIMDO|nr:unnamed protein product [Timema douglasi]